MSARETVWIVDYDFSMSNSRRQFYREVKAADGGKAMS